MSLTRGPLQLLAPVLLLLAASCGDGAREQELACQQRLVDAIAGGREPAAVPGKNRLDHGFGTISRRFADMPLDGCTESQRHTAAGMSRLTADLTAAIARLDVMRRSGRYPELAHNRSYIELAALVEQYDARRRRLLEDLDRMNAERR